MYVWRKPTDDDSDPDDGLKTEDEYDVAVL